MAFQKAFTLELLYTLASASSAALALPLFALLYGQPEIIAAGPGRSRSSLPAQRPAGAALDLLPADGLRAPAALAGDRPGRRRSSSRSRSRSPAPATGPRRRPASPAAGRGGRRRLLASPYKLAPPLRPRHAARVRRLLLAAVRSPAAASLVLVAGHRCWSASRSVGLAGVGAIALAVDLAQFADRVDEIVTGTLYPAICAVRDRTDLLFESFVKSNRLALMWGDAVRRRPRPVRARPRRLRARRALAAGRSPCSRSSG